MCPVQLKSPTRFGRRQGVSCSVLWADEARQLSRRTSEDNLLKTKVKRKQSLSHRARRGLKLSSSKVKTSNIHPYSNGCMKPESLHNITLHGNCNVLWGLLTFKLRVTSLWSWRSFLAGSQKGQGESFWGVSYLELQFFTPFGLWFSSFVLDSSGLRRP